MAVLSSRFSSMSSVKSSWLTSTGRDQPNRLFTLVRQPDPTPDSGQGLLLRTVALQQAAAYRLLCQPHEGRHNRLENVVIHGEGRMELDSSPADRGKNPTRNITLSMGILGRITTLRVTASKHPDSGRSAQLPRQWRRVCQAC